jgi:hypothetical protein
MTVSICGSTELAVEDPVQDPLAIGATDLAAAEPADDELLVNPTYLTRKWPGIPRPAFSPIRRPASR